MRGVLDVQVEVEFAERELPHVRHGGEVIARGDHLLEKARRNCFAGLVVPREKIEALAFPAEILHDLAGQLDEIPRAH